jgi:hypothetical protein
LVSRRTNWPVRGSAPGSPIPCLDAAEIHIRRIVEEIV